MRDDLVNVLRVVSAHDPALDRLRMPMDLYYETRDPSLVIELPCESARWFSLRALTTFEAGSCDTITSEPAKFIRAFQLACVAIENFASPGIAMEPTLRVPRPDGTERLMWRDSELERIADEVGLEVIYEVGMLALERRRLGKWGRGDVSRFTPPLFLGPVLEQIRRLRAEHTETTGGTLSSERSAPG
jgi:hypothetical protein